jgi:hypothetical protein
MLDPDLKTTRREFREYVTLSYELPRTIASRIGLSQSTLWDWLAADANRKPSHWQSFGDFWTPRLSGHFRATGLGRVEPVPYKSSGTFSKCATLGSARSAEKLAVRFASYGQICFRASVQSVERAGLSGGESPGSAQGVEMGGSNRILGHVLGAAGPKRSDP